MNRPRNTHTHTHTHHTSHIKGDCAIYLERHTAPKQGPIHRKSLLRSLQCLELDEAELHSEHAGLAGNLAVIHLGNVSSEERSSIGNVSSEERRSIGNVSNEERSSIGNVSYYERSSIGNVSNEERRRIGHVSNWK